MYIVTKHNKLCGTCQFNSMTDRDKEINLIISKELFDNLLLNNKVIKINNPFNLLALQYTIINIYKNKNK